MKGESMGNVAFERIGYSVERVRVLAMLPSATATTRYDVLKAVRHAQQFDLWISVVRRGGHIAAIWFDEPGQLWYVTMEAESGWEDKNPATCHTLVEATDFAWQWLARAYKGVWLGALSPGGGLKRFDSLEEGQQWAKEKGMEALRPSGTDSEMPRRYERAFVGGRGGDTALVLFEVPEDQADNFDTGGSIAWTGAAYR